MANKKKNVEEKNKKVNKKDLKKEKEFEKLVAEEEFEEIDDFDDDFDDEDANEVVTVKEKKHNDSECGCGCNCNNENMVLKFLIGVSICISAVTLLLLLVVLSKVNNINSYYEKDEVVSSENGEDTAADYDVSMFEAISTSDFIEMFDKDDDKIRFVYTGRETCSYCVAFLPALQQSIKDYDYTLYYLDTTGVTESDYNKIIEFDEDLEESFLATPMVYAVKNGEVIDYNDGYTEYATYAEFLEDNKVKEK